MSSINVYVSQDLKERMLKQPFVNWSRVAQEAFEKKLDKSRDWLIVATQQGEQDGKA